MKLSFNILILALLFTAVFAAQQQVKAETPENDIECSLCKWVAEKLEAYVTSSTTESEIVNYLDSLCNDLPSTYANYCTAFVDNYGTELIELVIKEEDPETICSTIGICTTMDLPEPSNDLECSICKWVASKVESYIENSKTESEIIEFLDSICEDLPKSWKNECEVFVNTYAKELIDLLMNEVSPDEVCAMLGLCSTELGGEEGCSVCKAIVGYAEHYLTQSGTEEEIEKLLHKACNWLPDQYFQTCEQLIDAYLPDLVDYIVKVLTPEKVCDLIGVCKEEETANEFCMVCEVVMTYAEHFLSENSTEAEIEAFLEKVCSYLPKDYKTTCDLLVEQYTPDIIQYILNDASPKEICALLGVCSSAVQGGEFCTVCEAIMTYLEMFLSENSTEAEIEKLLDEVCSYLPKAYVATCDLVVNEYTPLIINYIINNEKPDAVCALLDLCDAGLKTKVKAPQDDPECMVCEVAMTFLEHLLSNNATAAEIEKVLDKLCDYVPAQYYQTCLQMIDTYEEEIIKYVIDDYTPKQICALLTLCTSETEPQDDPECMVCEVAMTFLEHLLSNNATAAEIEKVLDKLCDYVPAQYYQTCLQMIDTYEEEIIKYVIDDYTPKQICALLTLCSSEMKVVKEEKAQVGGDILCYACKHIIGFVMEQIPEDPIDSEIERALDAACSYIPEKYQDSCTQIVDQYTPSIVQYILDDAVPDLICIYLELCA